MELPRAGFKSAPRGERQHMKATAKTARTTRFRRRCCRAHGDGPRRKDVRGGCCAWRGGRYRFTVDCAISYPRALSQVPTDGIVKKPSTTPLPGSSLSRVDATANPQLAPSCDAPSPWSRVVPSPLCDRGRGSSCRRTTRRNSPGARGACCSPRVRCQESRIPEAKRMTVRIATNVQQSQDQQRWSLFSVFARPE